MTHLPALGALLALALLSACSNRENAGNPFADALAVYTRATQDVSKTVFTPEQINAAVAQTPGRLALIIIEKTETQALVAEVGRNGRYTTFGTPTRQAIVLKDGLLTGTRGLGGDLMSVDHTALERLVRVRQAGSAPYVLRLPDGEDRQIPVQTTCTTAVGGMAPVVLGAVNETARVVSARCSGDGDDFENTYLVAGDGVILSARQWSGDVNGYLSTQLLRR